ncbi:MAG: hypothetical protein K0S26_3494 [Bacteroidota bacterium]|nr:hypothetical protein [Bacteroidota bacterium]
MEDDSYNEIDKVSTRKNFYPYKMYQEILRLDLGANEKLILGYMFSFFRKKRDFFVSNPGLMKTFAISRATCTNTISGLIDSGYIVLTEFDGRKRILKPTRKLRNIMEKHFE